jgi:EAL domain-containing protein (putative c-di-GMP-specific phosphodiesterase class I)
VIIAVNLSPSQFRDPGLLDDIAAILADTGFDPTLLRLEISESVTQEDIEPAVALMQRARALGMRLALDDFGAGYAGWTFLRHCAVDTIKIDRSLLDDQADGLVDRARIMEAILAFARHLNVPVSIEGVERADQVFTMRSLGIPTAQGFYFAEPQPPHLLAPMLTGLPLQPIA